MPKYDVTTIQVPIKVFHGGRDTVIDASKYAAPCVCACGMALIVCVCVFVCVRLLCLLPSTVEVHYEELYEHLDFLWADTAKDRVFPSVEEFLRKHCGVCDPDSASMSPCA